MSADFFNLLLLRLLHYTGSFSKGALDLIACSYLTTEQTTLYLASVRSVELGECAATGGTVMK
jgi:hypothetical protein